MKPVARSTSRGAKPRIKPMTPGIPHSARVRAYLAGAVVTAGLVGVAFRAWALQVDGNEHYRALAERQHALTVEIPAPRGEILDAHGIPLAVSADADSVWANPREIRDVTATADKLAAILDVEPATLEGKLAGDRRFVWIDRHVTPEIAAAVRDAKLPGIEVAKEPRRWYPGKTLAGPVIGRADIDGNGLDGLELAMNAHLTGQRGEGHAVRDAHGRRMFADGVAQPEPGATVKLTLDRSIQAIADSALADAVHTHDAAAGVVVVLDVDTGKVLALASSPTYDPNTVEKIGAARNRTVTDSFEAGSVMKLFTVAAALDAGAVRPDTEFDVQMGVMYIPGRSRPIRDVHYDKYLTVAGIIKRSSNVGAVKIAQRLGKDALYDAFKAYGFGAKTKIELPGEQPGMVRPGKKWRDVELATIAFGYGITVTPLQIAAALAAIGNDGTYHPPRIVDSVIDADGQVVYRGSADARQVMSAKTAKQVRTMMATVFEGGKNAGTAASLVVPGFKCGGKTGTAHKYDHALRAYADNKYLSSFIGLAPIDHPRLAIVVIIDDPRGGDYYGGKVAGPVFAQVASESLRYLGVPGEPLVCPPPPPRAPGEPPPNPLLITIPPKTCIDPPKAGKPVLEPIDLDPVISLLTLQEADPIEVAPDEIVVPDFRGLGLGKALELARDAHVAVEVRGSGQVIAQDPLPGPARPVDKILLRFSDGDSPSSLPVPAAP
ncbi:MAG TPA: penicillin-binding transpeptidase domain-containing protein [Kofleriaceae bacterium]|nr:penicillin-binding transpeptidase domain-containing protein [Kofleriaceae bacterium]